jgi:hypothetical protein
MKTIELTGAALDWAAAKCEGPNSVASCYYDGDTPLWLDEAPEPEWKPSTDWAQGGPIIERGLIVISPDPQHGWRARPYMDLTEFYGPTPLVAAMRCYVVSKLGDKVDVPEGLL